MTIDQGRSGRRRWLVVLGELAGVTAQTGGIGRQYAAMLPVFADEGIDVDVVLVSRDSLGASPGWPRVQVRLEVPPGWARGALWMLWGAVHVRRTARAGGYDAVLAPEWLGLAAFVPTSTPLVTNLVTGARLADEIGSPSSRRAWLSRWSRWVQYALERRQVRRSHGVVAISQAILGWYRESDPALPDSRVIPNCIDVDRVTGAAHTAGLPPGWPGGRRVLLFVGRLEHRKGIVSVLEAFRDIAETRADVDLVAAGAFSDPAVEPDLAACRAILGPAAERALFLGDVRGDVLYRAMAEADAVLCPSRWEAFGQVALEAKAAGGALVVTRGSGFDDFCRDGIDCLAIEPGDSAALAEAAHRLLSDSLLRDRLVAGGRESVQEYTPSAVVPRYVDAVEAMVGRPS